MFWLHLILTLLLLLIPCKHKSIRKSVLYLSLVMILILACHTVEYDITHDCYSSSEVVKTEIVDILLRSGADVNITDLVSEYIQLRLCS